MNAQRITLAFGLLTLAGCGARDTGRIQGYVEGEFVYVASPAPGALEKLSVERGASVKAGDRLFALELNPEQSVRDEAAQRLAQAQSNLEDAKKGRRPSEIDSIEAQLRQARAAVKFSELEYVRQEKMIVTGAAAAEDLERARSLRDQDRQKVIQLEADLKTAQLGLRSDQVAAAESDVRARTASLAKAEWDLSQRKQAAAEPGLVFDTLYREGEWVPAGRPVVALLPPRGVKVRAFVSEGRVASIRPGQSVQVIVDGVADAVSGKVSFISPQAEYTPPVIYSRESRSKLVFMIEIRFEPEVAAKLHPGQPVDVVLEP